MGAAWCKNKTQAAIDKIQQVYPSGANQKAADKQSNDEARKDNEDVVDSPRVDSTPVKTPGTWQDVTLEVPEHEPLSKTPVPPPRKKRQLHRKMGMSRPPPPQPPASPPPVISNSSPITMKPRPKNFSTVSLPNYSELKTKDKQKKHYLSPDGSRKAPSVSSISDATVERVEQYLRKCRSFGSVREHLAEKLSNLDTSSDSDDSWAGLDDWDLGVIEHDTTANDTPIVPISKLNKRPERKSTTIPPTITEDDHVKEENTSALPPTKMSREDSWFGSNWSSLPQNTESSFAGRNGIIQREPQQNEIKDDQNINEVKKELQSIIYDFNRAKKISTSSMEVLPTQPIRTAKKKISVTSVTPPPSPEISDVEDNNDNAKLIESMIMNKTGEVDETTHSTLLRLLKECQNIEGALEQLGLQNIVLENTEIPGVHCYVRKEQSRRKLPNEERKSAMNACKSVDSGLDIHSNAEDKLDSQKSDYQSQMSFSASNDTLNGSKSIDSGLNDFEEHSSPIKSKTISTPKETETNTKHDADTSSSQISQSISLQNSALKDLEGKLAQKKVEDSKGEQTVHSETDDSKTSSNVLRKPKSNYMEIPESGGSSGRSSMTPSLSELEAALSDMLEKSTEEDDSSLPVISNNPFKSSTSTSVPSATNPFQDKTVLDNPPTANGAATKIPSEVH